MTWLNETESEKAGLQRSVGSGPWSDPSAEGLPCGAVFLVPRLFLSVDSSVSGALGGKALSRHNPCNLRS